ncbi:MAG: type II secretion system protein GspM [Phycisphaerae bacterium]
MIIEFLIRRQPRERWLLGLTGFALALVGCYVAAISPAREAVAEDDQRLQTMHSNLDLQQRQLTLLRAETVSSHRRLAELADAVPPWIPAAEADALLQQWQALATEVGLTLESVTRESQTPMLLDEGAPAVSLLVVRLEVTGPYGNVMALLRRLSEGTHAVGLEELIVGVSDEPPFDLKVVLLLRLGIADEGLRNG